MEFLYQILKDDAVKVLYSMWQQIWKTQQWPQDWERSVFIPIPKKGNAEEYSNNCIVALISHASKVMLKILQAGLQQYMNWELPDVQAGFRKDRGTRDQIANLHWVFEKAREFHKNIYLCFIDYEKAFNCVNHNWKILKDMGIPDHLTCLLRNLYTGQEATIRHGTTNWFQIGKGVRNSCILSTCLLQSTSCTMPGWMKQKLESRLQREMSITSDMQMPPPWWQKVKRNWGVSWWKWKRRVKKLA